MEIKNLTGISFETIYQTFLEAFKDYAVNVNYMDAVKLENRAIKNGFDPACSVGVFDQDRLVGFTLVGIDRNYIRPSAFDIMTGIIGEYRGQGVAGLMFTQIRNALLRKGIDHFYLEVLQDNEAAINAYQKEGFRVVREFNCYALAVEKFIPVIKLQMPFAIKPADRSLIADVETFVDHRPSWENSFSSMLRIPDELIIISASYSIKRVGLIVFYPSLNWIMALLVDPAYRNMGIGSALIENLLMRLDGQTDEIRFLNIPENDYALNDFLKKSGFILFTRQFEMRLELSGAHILLKNEYSAIV